MIQHVIDRMANNLFLLRGWSVTLITALLALMAANNSSLRFIAIAVIPILIFWLMDGYFLAQERQYRALYDKVSKQDPEKIDFSMNASPFRKGRNTWFRSFFSVTLISFYGLLSVLLVLIIYFTNQGKINHHLGNIWHEKSSSVSTSNAMHGVQGK